MDGESFKLTTDKKAQRLRLTGPLTWHELPQAEKAIARARKKASYKAADISGLTKLDTAGALLLSDIGREVAIAGASDEQRALLELVSAQQIILPEEKHKTSTTRASIIAFGRYMVRINQETHEVIAFFGRSVLAMADVIRHPNTLRMNSIAHHIEAIGIQAMPIIGLMAFVISVVLAYQGIAQLRPYGGQQFTVNLVALSILREMGVLLTAIMVAGRSGSAFTAEIGVMKSREEIDALRVLGVDPFNTLVVPRLVAIVIALPLLTMFANFMGLVGGYFIIDSLIDISVTEYLDRIKLYTQGWDLWVGLIKAPVFAFMIGIVGCLHGMRVTGSAESVGRETTNSVVKSIFLVLVLDGCFSILFEKLGI